MDHVYNESLETVKNAIQQIIKLNDRNIMDGRDFLSLIPDGIIPVAFFDPQYRGVLDRQKFGNEGKTRGKFRSDLEQMSENIINKFIDEIGRVLKPSGHLFLWIDKYHLCEGINNWIYQDSLSIVDMITWNKARIGMGYRSRRQSEFLVVIQKKPVKAKGVWTKHNIPDVWTEKREKNNHKHRKPVGLQTALIESTTNPEDIVIDPAAGSYSVMDACHKIGRNFVGTDLISL